ncbi:putative DUF21 domain-containing protein At1g03270 [Zea mays]|uniref:uncharacterized protein LOC103652061 n=1 Tax=Zea mays TaxID=4577 RepID=UPI0009A9BBC3|nr:uncharacterized protein LOC103652061 [Zea mays]XP_020395779.1 putative DUF21 domain-containing protein At1g03270 [Zea mays]XP_020395840.1 putative DUF21 domain-containing protein At1g03270 [Zea mays]XP_020397964.1 putative DUF21 domain-containing protein At1g03270 [Zea mays]XP_020399489.1 putative DUF21 domain-containing protein At1g03270 [Zea mays]|eukprot:XP_020395779.1 putative DUF21 domain-containing protein At1g03270 isoform X2 [Zea mays]
MIRSACAPYSKSPGIMSRLTLGSLLGLVELEILQHSGTDTKAQATVGLPVVQKQHQLHVTLLLCNVAAMEALPIFLIECFIMFFLYYCQRHLFLPLERDHV